jgi:hypothetical protein
MMLYERVVLSLLRESKMDTFARKVTQKVINASKKVTDKLNKVGQVNLNMMLPWPKFMKRRDQFSTALGKFERWRFLGKPTNEDTIKVVLSFQLSRGPRKRDNVDISGSWRQGIDELSLTVHIDSTTGAMKPTLLSMVQDRAYEVVRHELEHATQTQEKLMGGSRAASDLINAAPSAIWKTPGTVREYYMSEAEIEAFVSGIYHRAKRSRTPFIKVLDEILEDLIKTGNSYGADPVKLRNVFAEVRYTWLQYAKKRFPKAVVTTA